MILTMPNADGSETPEEWRARMGVGEPSLVSRRPDSGPGSTKATTVMREDKPGVAGIQTDHWDGRRDATVFAEHARVKGKAKTQG